MPDRATCRELPWEDGGCWAMADYDGQGLRCTLHEGRPLPDKGWFCERLSGPVGRLSARHDPELEQGWEVVKRYGPAFRRFHGDEATA